MKTFSETIITRDFKKRFIIIAAAAVILLILSAVSVALLCHTQISEAAKLEKAYYEQEKLLRDAQKSDISAEESAGEHDKEEPEFFDMVTPLPVSSIVILCAVIALGAALAVFYWITIIEWLYKSAVRNGLNRALWPILGAIFNIFAVLAMLIVINEPKRAAVQTAGR